MTNNVFNFDLIIDHCNDYHQDEHYGDNHVTKYLLWKWERGWTTEKYRSRVIETVRWALAVTVVWNISDKLILVQNIGMDILTMALWEIPEPGEDWWGRCEANNAQQKCYSAELAICQSRCQAFFAFNFNEWWSSEEKNFQTWGNFFLFETWGNEKVAAEASRWRESMKARTTLIKDKDKLNHLDLV